MMIRDKLNELGFYKLRNNLGTLVSLAEQMSVNAGTNLSPRFEAFPSFIPREISRVSEVCQLIIDIGGTSTKVGIRKGDSWNLLFDEKNEVFCSDDYQNHSMLAYSVSLGHRLKDCLSELSIDVGSVVELGLVWSNAMANFSTELGVSGVVVQRYQYKKNEWFIADLKDGQDIGSYMIEGLAESGFAFRRILVSNDTCLTMKVVKNADAGMVASTGLNSTIVKNSAELGEAGKAYEIICNAESGGRFAIEAALLSSADFIGKNQPANTIELLSAGQFLPKLFVSYILKLKAELPEITSLAGYLEALGSEAYSEYRSKDLTLLLGDYEEFLSRRNNPELYNSALLELLRSLSVELYVRAAELCSVVAFASVANKFNEKDKFVVALDSRLAREVPLFWESFQVKLKEITPESKEVTAELVDPLVLENGKVSVPMLGLANALDSI